MAEVKAGTMLFNGALIDRCASEIQPYIDRCLLPFDELSAVAAVANDCRVFTALTARDGGACDRDEQCPNPFGAGGFTACGKTTSTCSTTLFAGQGGACIGSGIICRAGLDCARADGGVTGTCLTATGAGKPCNTALTNNVECGLGHWCDPGGRPTCARSRERTRTHWRSR